MSENSDIYRFGSDNPPLAPRFRCGPGTMARYPANIESISVERTRDGVALTLRRNDHSLSFMMTAEERDHLVRMLQEPAGPGAEFVGTGMSSAAG